MTLEVATELARRALWTAAELSTPVLLVGLVVGLLFAVVQAITQVHEQTISFIPKLIAMAAVVFVTLPWLLEALTSYAREVIGRMAEGGSL